MKISTLITALPVALVALVTPVSACVRTEWLYAGLQQLIRGEIVDNGVVMCKYDGTEFDRPEMQLYCLTGTRATLYWSPRTDNWWMDYRPPWGTFKFALQRRERLDWMQLERWGAMVYDCSPIEMAAAAVEEALKLKID